MMVGSNLGSPATTTETELRPGKDLGLILCIVADDRKRKRRMALRSSNSFVQYSRNCDSKVSPKNDRQVPLLLEFSITNLNSFALDLFCTSLVNSNMGICIKYHTCLGRPDLIFMPNKESSPVRMASPSQECQPFASSCTPM